MAIKRGPDGVPIDMPSVKHKSEPPTEATGAADNPGGVNVDVNLGDAPTVATKSSSSQTSSPQGLIFDDPPTTPARGPKEQMLDATSPSSKQAPDDLPTIVGRNKTPAASDQTIATHSEDPMNDPVAGWLVVVDGPGKGHFLKLGYGQNSIGRSPDERVSVNFGDSQISRTNHTTISYDPRGNQFYIQPGSGTNMTYLDNAPAPVLQPMVLAPFSHISIGESTLRFVPLCGEHFTWDQMEEK